MNVSVPAQRLPLIKDYSGSSPMLWLHGKPVTQSQLLGAAQAVARRLPASGFLLNICDSRYAFIVAFVAGLLSGRTSLLPPNRQPATLDELRARYPDSIVLTDIDEPSNGEIRVSKDPGAAEWTNATPFIKADQAAAIVFTSGSTGTPQPHVKSWRNLVMTAGYAAERLQTAGRFIVGTVPPQHMYGLETTVMPAFAGDAIAVCERPLFPEDLRRVLETMPAPRILVTTPVHLNAFLQAGFPYPAIERVVSATAPLSRALCLASGRQLGASIDEIYGCTETGSVATRHTRDGDLWTPYREARVHDCADGAVVDGPHLSTPVRLGDVVQIEGDGRFRLLGRSSDMVKVAGKRASLQDLTQKLLSLPGVEDAVFFVPHPDADVARTAALVIAPTRTEAELLAALAQHIDPAFLPRPLRKVDRLPRNEVGKLPRAALLSMLAG